MEMRIKIIRKISNTPEGAKIIAGAKLIYSVGSNERTLLESTKKFNGDTPIEEINKYIEEAERQMNYFIKLREEYGFEID